MASSHSDFAGDPAHPSEDTQELADDRSRETLAGTNSADGPRGHEADAGISSTDARTDAKKAAKEEITEEMIEAGITALMQELGGADLGGLFSYRDLAFSVYLAMYSANRHARRLQPRKNRGGPQRCHDTT